MVARRQDLVLEQGRTFTRLIRWETSPIVYKPITAIAQTAPALITAVGHGIPDGWRVGVINVLGMLEINAKHTPPKDGDLIPATYVGANQVSLNSVSSAGFDAYISGGYLTYYTPVDLTGFTAAMKIKDRIGGLTLATLVSGVGAGLTGITIDNSAKTITVVIASEDSAAYTWLRGVYDLELVSATGIVTAILTGSITVKDEVTT